jgi:hypothetical protein
MVMLPWLCFTIGACEMGLLLHSSCETPFLPRLLWKPLARVFALWGFIRFRTLHKAVVLLMSHAMYFSMHPLWHQQAVFCFWVWPLGPTVRILTHAHIIHWLRLRKASQATTPAQIFYA